MKILFFQYIQKLNRQERVVEEVKHVLKPHFIRKYITKDDYKEIMKKSVSKVSVLCILLLFCFSQIAANFNFRSVIVVPGR